MPWRRAPRWFRSGTAATASPLSAAGTAERDLAPGLVWSPRPGPKLPLLIVVENNRWGISTSACSQHGEHRIIDRGQAFAIPGEVVDGNDPIASWHAVQRGMAYCRQQRRPFMLEAMVSRLYGHSSSSGALRVKNEPDCIALFEEKLLAAGILDRQTMERVQADAQAEVEAASDQVIQEPRPTPEDVYRHTYAPSPVDVVYPDDYTGLPE